MRTVCLIPARGGSKRLPNKNLRPLADKPLLLYTLEAALEARCFDEVFVSSDDMPIMELALNNGASVDVRSPEMAGDTIKATEVVYEFLQRKLPDNAWSNVAMCLPTCPFRDRHDVAEAMRIFLENRDRCPRLVGVSACDRPQLALRKVDALLLEMREPDAYRRTTRSQDMETFYLPNGSIYIATTDRYMEDKTFFDSPMLHYVMPPERSFDIDYEYQFQVADFMMRQRKGTSSA